MFKSDWFWAYDDQNSFHLSTNSSTIRWFKYDYHGEEYDALYLPDKESFIQSDTKLSLVKDDNWEVEDRNKSAFIVSVTNRVVYTIKSRTDDQFYCAELNNNIPTLMLSSLWEKSCRFRNVSSG